MIKEVQRTARVKISRNRIDFLADKITQAATEPVMVGFMERLSRLLDSNVGGLNENVMTQFLSIASKQESCSVLQWIREYPRMTAMMAGLSNDADYRLIIESIDVNEMGDRGTALPTRKPEIPIKFMIESALTHGADAKAGNATLFRRCQVLSTTGQVLSLPFYSGNAIRGQIRDLLADHFLDVLGLIPRRDKPPVNLWFFHALYSGGALDEAGKAKNIVGKYGTLNSDAIRQFRDNVPPLSSLGAALSNRIINGRVNIHDARPQCIEWGTGDTPSSSLMEWQYLTRHEDHEGHDNGGHSGMIVSVECLKPGVILDGGLEIMQHANEIDRACIGKGLELLAMHGCIGGMNSRGYGRVNIEVEGSPDSAPYDNYLVEHKDKIIEYLTEMGAICTQQI